MKIALAQISSVPGQVESNVEKFQIYARKAADSGAKIVLFPEMSDTAYDLKIIVETAQKWPGIAYDAAAKAASDNGIYLIAGISEKDGDQIYNSLAVFSPAGELIERYRKIHLFTPAPVFEGDYCAAGSEIKTVQIEGVTFGLTICYDLRFPEIYRALVDKGATVMVNCAAWPEIRSMHWDILTKARAIESQAYFVAVDRIGCDSGLQMCGDSRVIAPFGEIEASAGKVEELVIADLDLDKVSEFREKLGALKSRRLDLFS